MYLLPVNSDILVHLKNIVNLAILQPPEETIVVVII